MPGTEVEPRPGRLPLPVPELPQRKRQSEAVPVRLYRAARRNRHVTVPAAVPVVAWTAAEIMHAYGAGRDEALAGAVLTLCVAFFARHKWDRGAERWYAFLSAAALWLWLWAAAVLGAASGTPGEVLGALLLVLSVTWGVPWYRHYRIRGRKDRENFLRDCRAFWDGHAAAFGVPGSSVIDAAEKPSQTWMRVQLIGGRQSLQTLKGAVHLIESAARVGHGMVRVEEVKGDASQADVFIKSGNPLKDPVAWESPFAPRSVHEDRVFARTETGEWATVPQRVSSFINGMTRSGKGNHLLLRVAQLSSCPDARTVYIDLKQRSARPLIRSRAVDWVITDRDEARAYLAMLCAEIAARARDWHEGDEQALATPSSPALFTLTDEANPLTSVTAGDTECARLLSVVASQGSGLEVYCDIATQYGSLEESVRTEQIRGNLALRVCYRTVSAEHGQFALGDSWKYDTSKLEEQGEYLYKLGPKARPEKVRAPHMPFALLEEIAAANAVSVRKPRLQLWCGNEPSVVPGLTWQEWWDRRWLRISPAFRAISPQYAEAAGELGEPSVTAPAHPAPAAAPPPDEESGAAVAARIAAETDGPDAVPTQASQRAAAGGAAQRRQAWCDALAAAGGGISPARLVEVSGVPRSTTMDYLRRLLERGAVTRPEDGVYRPVPGRSIHAELRAAREGAEALLPAETRPRLVSTGS